MRRHDRFGAYDVKTERLLESKMILANRNFLWAAMLEGSDPETFDLCSEICSKAFEDIKDLTAMLYKNHCDVTLNLNTMFRIKGIPDKSAYTPIFIYKSNADFLKNIILYSRHIVTEGDVCMLDGATAIVNGIVLRDALLIDKINKCMGRSD